MISDIDIEFEKFNQSVRQSRLYDRTYVYYTVYFILIILGLTGSIALLISTQNLSIQIINAFFLAIVFVQAGMFAHDLIHEQVFLSATKNKWGGVFVWGLFCGLSADRWFAKHNAHHRYVNQIGKDPDVNIPFIFSEKQKVTLSKWRQVLLRRQHYLFFLMLPLVYENMIIQAYQHLFRRFTFQNVFEIFLMSIHFIVLFWIVFSSLSVLTAAIFIMVHLIVMGLYMSLVFAPNHKGRAVLGEYEELRWIHQITSTRNIYPSFALFHIFGGLNFQIEHHLFSDIARPNYFKVQKLVKKFCAENNIEYHETGWIESLQEMYWSLKKQAHK